MARTLRALGAFLGVAVGSVASAEEPIAPAASSDELPEQAPDVAEPPHADDVAPEPDPSTEAATAISERKPPPSVSTVFTEDLEIRYWHKPERLPGFPDQPVLDYVEGVNRFTGLVQKGRFGFFGQVDAVALAANSYFLDGERVVERDLLSPGTWSLLVPGPFDPATHGTDGWALFSRNTYVNLEKVRFSYTSPRFELRVGDTYAAFGRGLALNLNRIVDIDIDTSIQGVDVVARPGLWDLHALVGQLNRQQVFQDNPNLKLFGDRRHLVAGLRVERHGLGPVTLGAHGTLFDFVDAEGWEAGFENLTTPPDVVVGGGTIEALGLGPTDWFLEVDGFGFPTDVAYGGKDVGRGGWSAYLSGAIYGGPTTWLIEAKRYDQSQRINSALASELYQAVLGPTLEYERQITEDSSAALGSNDVWGGRVRMDWTGLDGEIVPFWSVAAFRDLDLGSSHYNTVPETIVHSLVGLEWVHDAWSLLVDVGYRHDDRDGDAFGADRHVHGDLALHVPLPKELAFEINAAAESFHWGVNPIQQGDYVESEQSYSLRWRDLLTFTWFLDYSTNPLITTVGNLSEEVYGAGEIQIKPLPALALRLYYGSTKAGVRCSGGQCRVLPGFDGGKLSLTAQF